MVLLEALVTLWMVALAGVTVVMMAVGCLGALGIVTLARCDHCGRLRLVSGPPPEPPPTPWGHHGLPPGSGLREEPPVDPVGARQWDT
jgi:hypothetical protein